MQSMQQKLSSVTVLWKPIHVLANQPDPKKNTVKLQQGNAVHRETKQPSPIPFVNRTTVSTPNKLIS